MTDEQAQGAAYLRSVFPELQEGLSLHDIVKTGVVLCNLVRCIAPDARVKPDMRSISFVHGANVQAFVDFCRQVGVSENALPAPLAVVGNEPSAMRKLAICLDYVAKNCKIVASIAPPAESDEQTDRKAVTNDIADCKEWLCSIFPELDTKPPLCDIVQSGVVLCQLVNKDQPGKITKIDARQIPLVYGANIQKFLDYCVEIGIPQHLTFSPHDIVNKDANAVHNLVTCLMIFANLRKIGKWGQQQAQLPANQQEAAQIQQIAPEPVVEAPKEKKHKEKKSKEEENDEKLKDASLNAQKSQDSQATGKKKKEKDGKERSKEHKKKDKQAE